MTKNVKVGGEDRPVKFGFAALMEFTEENGLSMAELENLGDNMRLKDALFLVWVGLKHGARVEKKPFTYTVEEVADWLDDDPGAMERVLEVFGQSFSDAEDEKK